jgi:hypothetical protein
MGGKQARENEWCVMRGYGTAQRAALVWVLRTPYRITGAVVAARAALQCSYTLG